MKISDNVEFLIYKEYNLFKENMYAKKSIEERKKLDQFFTPPDTAIEMLKQRDVQDIENKVILDPTSGSGNLLVASIIAGANPCNIYGNEYDPIMVQVAIERIKSIPTKFKDIKLTFEQKEIIDNIESKLKLFNDWQIHQGNALIKTCLNRFDNDYNITILPELLARRNGLKGGYMNNPEAYVPIEKEREMNESEAKKLLETKERTDNQSQTNMDDYFSSYEE